MLSFRSPRFMLCLAVLILFLLPCAGLAAEFSIGTNAYVFLTDQSTVVQTGGFAGVHETYPIQGQFQLTVDANVAVASFDAVDANLLNPTGFLSTESLGELFNMTMLEGTVVSDALIEFRGKTSNDTNTDVSLRLTLTDDGTVQLTGQTIPPANSADFFVFNLDAVAQRKYSGGTGDPNDPYQIATAEDLILLGETPDDYDEHFIMIADIDLDPNLPGGKVFDRAVISSDWDNPFTGVFDGSGHIVSKLTIKGTSYLGLFGALYKATGPAGMVKNLGVVNVNIVGSGDNIGGLAGRGGYVIQCYSTGSINGREYVGGLVGFGKDLIQCYSTAVVSGYSWVGGLMGSGNAAHCYSTGAVSGREYVGGLMGRSESMTACYSTGRVSGTSDVGGLVGYSDDYSSVISCFWDIQSSGQTSSAAGAGKTTREMQHVSTFLDAGWDWVDEIANGTSQIWAMPDAEGYPILTALRGYTPVPLQGAGTSDAPYLISNALELGAMIHYDLHADFRLVTSIDLSGTRWQTAVIPWFAGKFDGNNLTITHLTIDGGGYLGLFRKAISGARISNLGLEAIDVRGDGLVGGLIGYNFDGIVNNCYTSGVVTGTSGVGGLVGGNGWWDYLKLSTSVFDSHSSCTVTGVHNTGGLVGWNYGNLTECYSTGVVDGTGENVGGLVGDNGDAGYMGVLARGNVTKCYSSAVVKGGYKAGGLVGNNPGFITKCYSTGTVSGKGSSWTSPGGVGGLLGRNSGTVLSCFSTSTVSGDNSIGGLVGVNAKDIYSCYSTGSVSGTDYVGGLVGRVTSSGSTTGSFWDPSTSGQTASDGGTGLTTAEMQTATTFLQAGWDFIDEVDNGTEYIWKMWDGYDYPRLAWEPGPDTPLVFVDINDPGVPGHEGFIGQMSKYETTNAQYCEYLNEALDEGLITVYNNRVYAAGDTSHSERFFLAYASDFASQITYDGTFNVRTRDGHSIANHPVTEVSRYGATAFCGYYGYRLPTEWEWQAVADYDGSYIYGCGTTINQTMANYNENGYANPLGLTSGPYTSPVGYYPAYGYGMCDMAGNVEEWTDSGEGSSVFRGGHWGLGLFHCTVSGGNDASPGSTGSTLGFRVCR